MPIAGMGDDYPQEHWERVRKIITRAVQQSGMEPRLVWENPDIDVIQTGILKNIYENDVAICDLSNLNPNVMLETGLRISTKRPTVIVTDGVSKPPFDINGFGYLRYPKNLEFNAIDAFIDELCSKIKFVKKSYDGGEYKSFVETFHFENVVPSTVNVPAEQFFHDQITYLSSAVARIERAQKMAQAVPAVAPSSSPVTRKRMRFEVSHDETDLEAAKEVVEMIDGVVSVRIRKESDISFFDVVYNYRADAMSLRTTVKALLDSFEQ